MYLYLLYTHTQTLYLPISQSFSLSLKHTHWQSPINNLRISYPQILAIETLKAMNRLFVLIYVPKGRNTMILNWGKVNKLFLRIYQLHFFKYNFFSLFSSLKFTVFLCFSVSFSGSINFFFSDIISFLHCISSLLQK